jgi:hypothetical protein
MDNGELTMRGGIVLQVFLFGAGFVFPVSGFSFGEQFEHFGY